MSEQKSFQVGIYTESSGDVIACLLPIVPPQVWGVAQSTGRVEFFDVNELRARDVVTLTYESEFLIPQSRQEINDTWAKLNAMTKELKRRKQLRERELQPLHEVKNLHYTGGSPPS